MVFQFTGAICVQETKGFVPRRHIRFWGVLGANFTLKKYGKIREKMMTLIRDVVCQNSNTTLAIKMYFIVM